MGLVVTGEGIRSVHFRLVIAFDSFQMSKMNLKINPYFALYFTLSRDVPILKSFSARRPEIIACCSRVCSALQRWLNYRGVLSAAKTEGGNKESHNRIFLFLFPI